jgi:hypothetical protein
MKVVVGGLRSALVAKSVNWLLVIGAVVQTPRAWELSTIVETRT